MAIEHRSWDEVSDEDQRAWGNVWTTVYAPGDPASIVWEGWATGWRETERGSLELNRRVVLDDEGRSTAFTFHQIAAGAWAGISIDSYVFDMEAIVDSERQREAQAAARREEEEAMVEAQRQAMIAQGIPLPPRNVRRQPPR